MSDTQLAISFAVAISLGALLGLERERSKGGDGGAGVRTFALISLAGALAGYLDKSLGLSVWALVIFVLVGVLLVSAYVVAAIRGDTGITTEVSALLAFLLGLLCAHGQLQLASAIAVVMALLLALKEWLHRLATQINTADVEATLKFAIVTLIILPLVPNDSYGPAPLDALNPYKIWLMVVLISALNFASYLVIKVVGPEHGIGLVGLLGGLASSTAVTLGFARRSQQDGAEAPALALGILLAWTVMLVRVAIMTALISWELGQQLFGVLGVLSVASLLAVAWLWRISQRQVRGEVKSGSNPFELSEAIKFGLLFGVVVLLARAAQLYFGDAGVYVASAVAGLTDVDAITLAMADLVKVDPASLPLGARAVVMAVLANTVAKSAMVLGLGSSELRRLMLPVSLGLLALGAAGLWLLL
ncbi:MgtC/SapB family protein [Rhodoferax sp. U2-2l]|uniref:MgtC/SapB family protein n=1 Tax=Rhodoferax sp. U2-2l TaxID=2884000 RepID=UPI001D0B21A6|nr:MgtC/SapB family protein [Rhodoferax sp. U2-2l]MCB8745577.1 MgtC/SapB family protein [Rhodoferax sp. U2-2l]